MRRNEVDQSQQPLLEETNGNISSVSQDDGPPLRTSTSSSFPDEAAEMQSAPYILLEEQSVSSDSASMDDRKEYLSNILFLLGSILFVGQAICNVRSEQEWNSPTPAPANEDDDASYCYVTITLTPYVLLSGAAALCYVLDAGIGLAHLTATATGHLQGFGGNRLLEIGAGTTFALGAMFEFASTLASDDNCPTVSDNFIKVGLHSYLFNAVLVLAGKPSSDGSFSDRLSSLGDLLFLIGSSIDVILTYFYDTPSAWKLVEWGNLISSILWLVDSFLYILAGHYNNNNDSEGTENLAAGEPLIAEEEDG